MTNDYFHVIFIFLSMPLYSASLMRQLISSYVTKDKRPQIPFQRYDGRDYDFFRRHLAFIGGLVLALPLVSAAGIEGTAVGDVVAATVTAHPAHAAVGRGSAPEGLVLGLVAPRATLDGLGLDGDEGGQQGADENDGGVHACRGLVSGWGSIGGWSQ